MSDVDPIRVGTAERDRAMAALAEHFAAGRLDSDEYEDRRGRAGDAVVRSDLDALFTDLPRSSSAPTELAAPGGRPAATPAPTNRAARRESHGPARQGGSNRWRGLVALSPFVALLLFFWTGSWLWFLLVPVAGIVYGTFLNNDD